ncbi:MAG TPA: hypothetical protein VH684_30380 [Xanthobacteraceae bacterium]|jgi:hypothetical protein
MENERLQEFVTKAAARGRITFGDLRRLQRGHLPGAIATWAQAELLIRLDAAVRRTDRAWTDWLVGAILDFVLSEEPEAADCYGGRDRLLSLLAAVSVSTVAARRISRGIQRGCEGIRPILRNPGRARVSQPLECVPVEAFTTEVGLAA